MVLSQRLPYLQHGLAVAEGAFAHFQRTGGLKLFHDIYSCWFDLAVQAELLISSSIGRQMLSLMRFVAACCVKALTLLYRNFENESPARRGPGSTSRALIN